MYKTIAIIGCGLIGSSILHAATRRKAEICEQIIVIERPEVLSRVAALELADMVTTDLSALTQADCVIFCIPVGAIGDVVKQAMPHLKPGATVTDVGSVKAVVATHFKPLIDAGHFAVIPGHPIAGTENSGPEAGFPTLFDGRWYILTPIEGAAESEDVERLKHFWQLLGARVSTMSPKHHDKVLAITSHIPHLIAYTIVGTAADLEDDIKTEVIQYSASGFRDFTRIAASDPTMWRDVFLTNKDAVLEALQRFTEDLTALQRAIRKSEGDTLFDAFTKTRAIRKDVIEA